MCEAYAICGHCKHFSADAKRSNLGFMPFSVHLGTCLINGRRMDRCCTRKCQDFAPADARGYIGSKAATGCITSRDPKPVYCKETGKWHKSIAEAARCVGGAAPGLSHAFRINQKNEEGYVIYRKHHFRYQREGETINVERRKAL